MNRRRNLILLTVGLVAAVAVGVMASRPHGSGLGVHTLTLRRATFKTTVPETGVVERPHVVAVPALVGGNVTEMIAKPGDRVVEGQLLATISNDQLVENARSAADDATSAQGREQSIAATNATLPLQNRSSVEQAQAALVQARATLVQAREDETSGQQSGLGYAGGSAEQQRLTADANLSRAKTELDEATRLLAADRDLYAQKAISRDTLYQAQARFDNATVAENQAATERRLLGGQLSREGQILRDRVTAAENGVAQAQAALDAAKANAAQSKNGDLVAARADARRAAENADYALMQVHHLRVVAPSAGIVQTIATQPNDALRPLGPGDPVTPGQTLYTIAGNGPFLVRTRVDEQDVAAIAVGDRVEVTSDDFVGKTLRGRIVDIAPAAQRSSDPSNTARQVLTTIALDDAPAFLHDGMSVDVDVIAQRIPNAIAVPNDAIYRDKQLAYVYTVAAGKARKTPIVTGAANDSETVVTKGLASGDVVISDKVAAIVPDARVSPLPSPSPNPSASASS